MITIIAPDYSRDGLFIMSDDTGKQMRNSHKKSYSELVTPNVILHFCIILFWKWPQMEHRQDFPFSIAIVYLKLFLAQNYFLVFLDRFDVLILKII
jgi:hypothetical protein